MAYHQFGFDTIFALLGAAVAITENRPSEAGGWSTGLTPVQDFLYGNGTALCSAKVFDRAENGTGGLEAIRVERPGGRGPGGRFTRR
jgi:hypothetical protein